MSYLSSLVSSLSLGYGSEQGEGGASADPPQHLVLNAPNVKRDTDSLEVAYSQRRNRVERAGAELRITPEVQQWRFRTGLRPRRTGLMLVGLGGNNGSTLAGALAAHRQGAEWRTRDGPQRPDFLGSVTQCSTVHVGFDGRQQVHLPFGALLPLVRPTELQLDGWDINGADLYQAALRARVYPPELLDQLRPALERVRPRPSVYYPDFIAANQAERADNLLPGQSKQAHLDRLRQDIREFREQHQLGECGAGRAF